MSTLFRTARDPVLSLFQSAAAAVARALQGAEVDASRHALPAAAAHVVALRQATLPEALTLSTPPLLTCAKLGLDLLDALVTGDHARARTLADRLEFSGCDPLWSKTLFDYALRYRPDGTMPPIPYLRHAALDDFVLAAPSATLRIALISDWGTGTDAARRVAALLADQLPDAVIHLGDIYYSGTAEECDRHFLAPLRAVLPDCPLFTLCGNHDVYSGGDGYYGLLRQIGQPASYFCLRSPDRSWQVLAADTGMNDRNPFDETTALTSLDPGEEAWHADKLHGFAGRTIFLTHHQPFSATRQIGALAQHDAVNPNLMASHARLSEAGRIDAWFWGHEHRLHVYAPFRGIRAGRNIGYGAVPVDAYAPADTGVAGLGDAPGLLAEVPLDVVDGAYTHGFVMLACAPSGVRAEYWALTRPGGAVFSEAL